MGRIRPDSSHQRRRGRDQWLQVSCAFLAGGGIRGGQAIGATNRLGEYAKDRPVPMADIVATLYHNLGIDVTKGTFTDPTGRSQYLVEAQPIPEPVWVGTFCGWSGVL